MRELDVRVPPRVGPENLEPCLAAAEEQRVSVLERQRIPRPVAQGMAAAMPSIDAFLPVHNLARLSRVGRELMSLARG